MFREMRRRRQALGPEACAEILARGTAGVLALAGDDGYPYAVPLSYAVDGGRLLFHSARAGHKLDAVRRCDKASFCVIDRDQVVPEAYTTYFRSVIVFGRIRVLEDDTQRRAALLALAVRYSPNDEEGCRRETESQLDRVCILELQMERISGKEAIELVQQREKQV